MQTCKRYTVSGLVQGVGFRYHTQRMATVYGLTGWVRNLGDGNVELVACGKESQLDCFYDWLCEGPGLARVENVVVEEITDRTTYERFSIR